MATNWGNSGWEWMEGWGCCANENRWAGSGGVRRGAEMVRRGAEGVRRGAEGVRRGAERLGWVSLA